MKTIFKKLRDFGLLALLFLLLIVLAIVDPSAFEESENPNFFDPYE